MSIVLDKRCTKCGEWKSFSDFYYTKRKDWEGYKAACKACTLAERRISYRANPEKYKEKQRIYFSVNPEQIRARSREWGRQFPEKVRARVSRWKKENPDKVRVNRQKYDAKHPDKVLEKMHRRRAKRISVEGGHFTEAEWLTLLDRYGHKCLACGVVGVNLERDHVIPLGPPGSDEITNIQPLCRSCNASKGNRIIDYR